MFGARQINRVRLAMMRTEKAQPFFSLLLFAIPPRRALCERSYRAVSNPVCFWVDITLAPWAAADEEGIVRAQRGAWKRRYCGGCRSSVAQWVFGWCCV